MRYFYRTTLFYGLQFKHSKYLEIVYPACIFKYLKICNFYKNSPTHEENVSLFFIKMKYMIFRLLVRIKLR